MALLFVDGFDYYPTADLPKKWTSVISDFQNVAPTIDLQGRFGTNTGALQIGQCGNAGVSRSMTGTSIITGLAFKTTAVNTGTLFTLVSSGNANYNQAVVSINNGTLNYTNGNRNSVSINSNVQIVPNIWYYIEFKTTITSSAAAGSTQVRLNGVVVIDVPAGTNTIGDNVYNSTTFSRLVIAGSKVFVSGNVTAYLDDIYICDTTGTSNNDFLGDIRIETLFPNAAGDQTGFMPSANANWQCVNETPEDGDSSYVSSSAIGAEDLYNFADLSSNPTSIKGIQVSTIARKDDAGNRVITPVVKSGGTEYSHAASQFGLADGYTENLDIWEQNPNTNSAWTGPTVNAIQAGIKVTG